MRLVLLFIFWFSLLLFFLDYRYCCSCWAFPFTQTTTTTTRHFMLFRGEGLYGAQHNSTIWTADQATQAMGIKPLAKTFPLVWKFAIRFHQVMIPLLHWNDKYRPPDSQKSLLCLWWKALIALDLSKQELSSSPLLVTIPSSTTSPPTTSTNSTTMVAIPNDHQHQLAYQLLPKSSRWILKVAHGFFPRLHHANVEIRTVFLNRAIATIVHQHRHQQQQQLDATVPQNNNKSKIRLIYFGAGYDVRSIYLQQQHVIDQAIELDLPQVLHAKQRLFSSPRFRRYCTRETSTSATDTTTLQQLHSKQQQSLDFMPIFCPVDLNDLEQVRTTLLNILQTPVGSNDDHNNFSWLNIFLFEGVMIYLQPGIPHGLLQLCSEVLLRSSSSNNNMGMLCFADRLENIPGGDETLARQELQATGWDLIEWVSKPGLARHMGVARLLQAS